LPTATPLTLPLIYQHEPVGHLRVAQRSPDEPFTPAERRLLEDIAHQAGLAVHAVRLTADLQRSRERLVTTREEERRRLRRDLHDGLGPQLASYTLKLEAARDSVQPNPERATALLNDLLGKSQTIIADVRRLVYGLRPPALDELGLSGAIHEFAAQSETNGTHIAVSAPQELPPLPAAVEVAAYRIVQEAVNNVIRHAQAKTCGITLSLTQEPMELSVVIRDDGVGLTPAPRAGVGLNSMRERAAELGGACVIEAMPEGGTRVTAKLPMTHLE